MVALTSPEDWRVGLTSPDRDEAERWLRWLLKDAISADARRTGYFVNSAHLAHACVLALREVGVQITLDDPQGTQGTQSTQSLALHFGVEDVL